jgi:transcriptional regulator with XRE-family HTH domain
MRNSLPSSSAVGQALLTRREHRGLTRARVARESGVSVADLGAIESGRSQASIGVLGHIAQTLGSTLTELVRGAGQTGGSAPPSRPASGLGLVEIAQAITELPSKVGSKVDAVVSASVLRAMAECGNNQSAAARLLGMERKAFVRRLSRARRKT